MCFRSVQKTIYFIFLLISYKNTYKLKVWSFKRLHLFVFFKDWLINFFEQQSLWSLIVKCPRCPILSSCEILCNILLNLSKLGGCFCLLMQSCGSGLVMACPYWLLLSIFNIFVEILFVCFLPSMCKSNNTY